MPLFKTEEFSINKKTKPRRKVSKSRKFMKKMKGKSRKSFVMMSIWLLITTVATICWFTIGGVAWGLASLLGGLITVASVLLTFNGETVEPGPRSQPKSTGSARGKAPSNRSGKRSPQKPRKCSTACRASTKPITDCECVCGGRTHGAKHRDP